jgi:soluble lytic murein transglycosylase-like protein
VWAIGYLETRFNPKAVSRKGARGLMQLMPATAAHFGACDSHDPIAAIDAAARYLGFVKK